MWLGEDIVREGSKGEVKRAHKIWGHVDLSFHLMFSL